MTTVIADIRRRQELVAPMVEQAKKEYTLAAAAFAKNPSADNWKTLRIAMFAYQQATVLRNSSMYASKMPEFMVKWASVPPDYRAELIVRMATGNSINQIDIFK